MSGPGAFADLSIRAKTTLAIVLVSAVTVGIGLVLDTVRDIGAARQELMNVADVNGRLVAQYLTTPLAFGYEDEAEDVLAKLESEPLVVGATVYGSDFQPFASYTSEADTAEARSLTSIQNGFHSGVLHTTYRVTYGDEAFGTVYLKFSTAAVDSRIRQSVLRVLLLVTGLVALASVLAWRVGGAVARPLLELAQLTRRMSEEDDYSLRMPSERRDEVGTLYRGFNAMLERIHLREHERDTAYAALEAERSLLADRVVERTEEARRARDRAEAANRAKSTFLANMSHELRTPMNAILGYSEMLTEDAKDEGHEHLAADLTRINTSGKHLLSLIDNILDLSKIEAGRTELHPETFDVENMLEEVVQTVTPLVRPSA